MEVFFKNYTKRFNNVLIILEDEKKEMKEGTKTDFPNLFIIVFENVDILIMLFISLTNCINIYINEFTKQLCDDLVVYTYDRKYDYIYFLLSNTDYIIKNSQTITFLTYNDITINYIHEYLNNDSFL